MPDTRSRNFNNFYLGDNVHELAQGVIPDIAERLDFKLDREPNAQNLGELIGKIGKNKVLRDNADIPAIDRVTAVDLVGRSGVQDSMNRSLWGPEIDASSVDAMVLTGAVANWQDRGAVIARDFKPRVPVFVAAGTRVMDSPTEQNNPNVRYWLSLENPRFPSEAEYAASIIVPRLASRGREVLMEDYDTSDGDELARHLFERNPALLERKIAFVRVANAGVLLANQMRKAARTIDPTFDSDPQNPQVYVVTDSFPLAETAEQENDPVHYQKALTALRQVAVTARMIHEASGGE